MVNKSRVFTLVQNTIKSKGPVVYWMSRDQRVNDNWALLFAAQKANEHSLPLSVVFTLGPSFENATLRHYDYMIKGLQQIETELKEKGISFYLLLGNPPEQLATFISQYNASAIVTDFDPLRIKRKWKAQLAEKLELPFFEVDAHNIVPCRFVSQKVEFGAYSLRPKINKLLPEFLVDIPELPVLRVKSESPATSWSNALKWLNLSNDTYPISWLAPGYAEGISNLNKFIVQKLKGYASHRNNPVINSQSNLSPYLHFGQVSAQKVAVEVIKANAPKEDKDAFLDELIVRRELSDNFCFYNPNYDNPEGFHEWAKKSHTEHAPDEREYTYSLSEFENAKTHDALWNAAQMEMVITGKMHGYMRMYWAKKILEWTKDVNQAMEFAIFLNDRYSLDGRDPNGYAGIAWSIGGVHDRAWNVRPVFGKVRYMNYNGCRRKFNVDEYISAISNLTKK